MKHSNTNIYEMINKRQKQICLDIFLQNAQNNARNSMGKNFN